MKKFIFLTTAILGLLATTLTNTSCSNDFKDMTPGQVRLKENDYRNEDNISGIEFTMQQGDTTLSAVVVRTLWHAVVLDTEKAFETLPDGQPRTYASPIEAEEAFRHHLGNSFQHLHNQFPDSYEAVLSELHRAKAHLYARYVWCDGQQELVNLKFLANPADFVALPKAE